MRWTGRRFKSSTESVISRSTLPLTVRLVVTAPCGWASACTAARQTSRSATCNRRTDVICEASVDRDDDAAGLDERVGGLADGETQRLRRARADDGDDAPSLRYLDRHLGAHRSFHDLADGPPELIARAGLHDDAPRAKGWSQNAGDGGEGQYAGICRKQRS